MKLLSYIVKLVIHLPPVPKKGDLFHFDFDLKEREREKKNTKELHCVLEPRVAKQERFFSL